MMYGLAKDFSSDFRGKGTDCNNKFNNPFNNLEESANIPAFQESLTIFNRSASTGKVKKHTCKKILLI